MHFTLRIDIADYGNANNLVAQHAKVRELLALAGQAIGSSANRTGELIDRNIEELERYGTLPRHVATPTGGGPAATGCEGLQRFDRTGPSLADLVAQGAAEEAAAKIVNLADARSRLRPSAPIAAER